MPETSSPSAADSRSTIHVIDRVAPLKWGVSGDCTFLGALAAATAVTPHPWDYHTLMGVTGLAFRTRWFQGKQPRWCPSSPVGEFPEEVGAVQKATGWKLRLETDHKPMARLAPDIVASVEAGLPVLAYDAQLNMALIVGYEDDGRTSSMQGYMTGDAPLPRQTADLPMFALFLDEHTDPLSPLDAARQGIGMGVKNLRREHEPEDSLERGYWYGKAAFVRWREDVGSFDSLSEEERGLLFFVSWWNFEGLADARHQAAPFLKQVQPLFGGEAGALIERAAEIYAQEAGLLGRTFVRKDVFLGPWTGRTMKDWTAAVRDRECAMLAQASRLEVDAVDLLAQALAAG